MRLGGDGVRISRKGIVRARGVCGMERRRVRRGHRVWRGDVQSGANGAQGVRRHAAGGCQGGAAAPGGGSGLGEPCVGAPEDLILHDSFEEATSCAKSSNAATLQRCNIEGAISQVSQYFG